MRRKKSLEGRAENENEKKEEFGKIGKWDGNGRENGRISK